MTVALCSSCPFKGQPRVQSEGDPDTCKYVLLGEAPAYDEIREGRPFVGATGRLLMKFMERTGISRDECYIMNALLCQLPKDKKGIDLAVTCCRPRLLAELEKVNSEATLAVMGKIARDALYPYEQGGILASRGWREYKGRDTYVMSHPAFILYNPNEAPLLLKDLTRLKRGRLRVVEKFTVARAIQLEEGGHTWVDDEDHVWALEEKWKLSPGGYARAPDGKSRLHRAVADMHGQEVEKMWVDHINRNRLDNRSRNLRPVLPSTDANKAPPEGGSSKYKGVQWRRSRDKWRARLTAKGVGQQHLGHFDTEEGAARAYDVAAKAYYGDLAYLNFPEPPGEEWTAFVIDTRELLEGLLAKMHSRPLAERGYVAFDLETDQVDFQRDRILCMSISVVPGTAYVIPDSLLYQDGHEWVTTGWSKDKREMFLNDFRYITGAYLRPNWDTVALLRELFSVPKYEWVGHNAKFDLRFLRHLGVENAHCDFDTIVAHYALDERRGGHALKPLADDYFDSGNYEAELFNFITKKSARYSAVPRGVLYGYNAMDTELTLRLALAFEKELKQQGLWERPFLFPMMAAIPMLLDAELEGVQIDWEELDRVNEEELEPALNVLTEKLREISGRPELNPLSSVRVNDILYDELNFPMINVRTRAAGKRIYARSSQKAVMDGWAKLWAQGKLLGVTEEAWGFAKTLQEYRHLRKMRGSYVNKWKRYRGTDDRVHTSYLLRGTVTGRLSAKDPPLQTIPSKVTDRWGPLIANVHVSRPGWKLVYADYAQAELMAAACLSGDEFMIKTFLKGDADYHSEVALAAFGEDFTRDERQASKKLTFGWLYGGNVREIALDALQFEGAVAERFAHEWDDLFAGVITWRKAQAAHMREHGYVESVFGRRRRYLLLSRENIGKAMRVAVNAPIQSAVSDLALVSAVKMHQAYGGSDFARVILLIHDSLVVEVRDDMVEEVRQKMQEVMVATAKEYFPQVPFRADTKVSTRLGDLT